MVGTALPPRQIASPGKKHRRAGHAAWSLQAGSSYIRGVPKRNFILFVVVCLSCLAAHAAREQAAVGRRFGEVMSLVESSYFEHVDEDRLFETAVDAALGGLDDHSAYIRGDVRTDLEAALDQKFGGVGLELFLDERVHLPVVASPVVDSPAWRAGIRAGDRLEAIDGEPTSGVPLRDVVARLRGPVGGKVMMRVATPAAESATTLDPGAATRGSEVREVVLVRELIQTQSVLGDRRTPTGDWEWLLEGSPGVGFVRITSFGERTAAELAAALDAIAATDNVRGLVVDLRGNPGGLLGAAVDVCDLFLDDGVIVHTRGRDAKRGDDTGALDARRATPGAKLPWVPVVVIVDGLTASAAEIVAACLQDSGRATVVGSRTFGKGTVQSILPLSDDRGLLKLTTAEYLRPSRMAIHRRAGDRDDAAWGVSPDAGCEVSTSAETIARVASWRRQRDAAGQVPSKATARGLPREIDPMLARGLEALAGDLSGEEEASGHDDDSTPAGE